MDQPQVIAAIITASVTIAGAILTVVYSFFHEHAENRRHSQQLEIEVRREKLDENRLAIELYNQREIRLFEVRLQVYPEVYKTLMGLASRDLLNLSASQALEIEKQLKEIAYTKVSACISAKSLESLTNLRDTLALFAKNEAGIEEVRDKRIELFQTLHKDLGRTGHYLGEHEPQIVTDRRVHMTLQK